MKLHLLSDIHLEFGPYLRPFPEADGLLLAGDICVAAYLRPWRTDKDAWRQRAIVQDFFERATKAYPVVYYVFGNHEHYRGDLHETEDLLRAFFEKYVEQHHKIHILTKTSEELTNGMTILGATMWTDYNNGCPLAAKVAEESMNDYKQIENNGLSLNAGHLWEINDNTKNWLYNIAKENTGKQNLVVMTHHAPSLKSVHHRFQHDIFINGSYVSDLEYIMETGAIKLWVHGHTHDSFDYMVGETRVVCNPRGYVNFHPTAMNLNMDSGLVLEV